MERAASNTKTWLFSAYSAKRLCFEVQFQFIAKFVPRYFEGVFPYNLLPYDLPYSKKFSGAMVGLLKFGGNSFSLLLSFMFTLTFQVLMLQKLLLLFSKGANPSPGASPVFLTVTQVNQYTCIARSALCTGNYDLYVLVTQVSNDFEQEMEKSNNLSSHAQ